MDEILEIKNLKIVYESEEGNVHAVRGVSLSLKEGEFLGIAGESGCGKSTLAFSILRLLPENAKIYEGEIKFRGTNLLELKNEEMRKIRWKEISMVFQSSMNSLNPVMKIKDQIYDAIIYHSNGNNIEMKDLRETAEKLLSYVNISPEYLEAYPHQLSGGMKQRVMIAMALSCRPKLLIADEPTTALDVTIQKQILWLMKSLREKHGFSILFITHDMGVVAEFAHRVGVMYAGSIVEIATKRRLFKNPLHPYTVGLLNAVPNPRVGGKLRAIPGSVPSLVNPPTGCRFNERCERAFRKCFKETPPLIEVEDQHYVACHVYGGDENG